MTATTFSPASTARSRPGASTSDGDLRCACYARTNKPSIEAVIDLARQYRSCIAVVDELGVMTRLFFDAPGVSRVVAVRVLRSMAILVRDEGSRDDLTTALAGPDRDFQAIICADMDRLPRRSRQRAPLLAAADAAGVRWIVADQPSTQDPFGPGDAAAGLLQRYGSQGWAVSASGDAA